MDAELNARLKSLEILIDQWGESLQSEMREGFDRVDASTKRNTGMIVSGTLAIAALKKWAAAEDARNKRRDAGMRDLRDRVRKLERGTRKKTA